jgi:hypothetical protein
MMATKHLCIIARTGSVGKIIKILLDKVLNCGKMWVIN